MNRVLKSSFKWVGEEEKEMRFLLWVFFLNDGLR